MPILSQPDTCTRYGSPMFLSAMEKRAKQRLRAKQDIMMPAPRRDCHCTPREVGFIIIADAPRHTRAALCADALATRSQSKKACANAEARWISKTCSRVRGGTTHERAGQNSLRARTSRIVRRTGSSQFDSVSRANSLHVHGVSRPPCQNRGTLYCVPGALVYIRKAKFERPSRAAP
jgi:hypothetical protein